MKILIIAQNDLKAGVGHVNRSRLLFKNFKQKKIDVDFFSFYTKNRTLFYDHTKSNLNKKLFYRKVKEANIIITDEVSCPRILINLIKKKFVCSISPYGKVNYFAKIIFSRTEPVGVYSDNTVIKSGLSNFLPGSNFIKVNKALYEANLKKKSIKIGISMGGYDKRNKTLKLLKIFNNIKSKIKLNILLNDNNFTHYKKILRHIKNNKINAKTFKMKKNSWDIFSKCSLLLLSGGISAYESVFAGIPSINIINDPIKKKITQYLAKQKLTTILEDKHSQKIHDLIYLYVNQRNLMIKKKRLIDNFVSKIYQDPYKKLLKFILQEYKLLKNNSF